MKPAFSVRVLVQGEGPQRRALVYLGSGHLIASVALGLLPLPKVATVTTTTQRKR